MHGIPPRPEADDPEASTHLLQRLGCILKLPRHRGLEAYPGLPSERMIIPEPFLEDHVGPGQELRELALSTEVAVEKLDNELKAPGSV